MFGNKKSAGRERRRFGCYKVCEIICHPSGNVDCHADCMWNHKPSSANNPQYINVSSLSRNFTYYKIYDDL